MLPTAGAGTASNKAAKLLQVHVKFPRRTWLLVLADCCELANSGHAVTVLFLEFEQWAHSLRVSFVDC